MNRAKMIEARVKALSELSTENLAIAIGEYFDTHATLPGQKDLKSAAEKLVANIAEDPSFNISPEAKSQMITAFADIVVREMKVEKVQVKNVNKDNKDDFSVLKPTDLSLTEIASIPAEGKTPAKKVYSADARIEDGKVLVGDYEIGSLAPGFVKNNPGVSCSAILIATDYSNGKYANMGYSVVADIAA